MAQGVITRQELAALARDRGRVYGWLSPIYLRSPGEDFVLRLRDTNFLKVLSSLSQRQDLPAEMRDGLGEMEDFARSSRQGALEEVLKDLRLDYTRLFRGVKRTYSPPPPYESVYLEGQRVMDSSTARVSKEYREAGVAMGDVGKGEPPDHVGFELDFMRHLCTEEGTAWETGSDDQGSSYLGKERKFLREHLRVWVPRFCDAVMGATDRGFYLGLARTTKAFIIFEDDKIDQLVEASRAF
jgi:TorA maturation chaperone TorD